MRPDFLAIIPARGGSKGVPRKNLRPIRGKPLIAYTIEAARGSATVTRTIVSTEDKEIAAVGRAFGAEVPFTRPPELAADETPMIAVLQHALEWYHSEATRDPDGVVVLQPTSPLRTSADIDAATDIFLQRKAACVVSVIAVPHQFHPTSLMTEIDGRLVHYAGGPGPLRRQDKGELLARNGPAVIVVRADELRHGRLYGDPTIGYRMSRQASLDVDDESDLQAVERLMVG